MLFRNSGDARLYAVQKYSSLAANIFEYFCHDSNWKNFWDAVADGQGTGSNSPHFSLGADLPYLYDDFETPVEAYGYVSFWLDFDTDFELEERMSLPDFMEYLKDANAIARQMYPEEDRKLKSYLEQAIKKISKLQKDHEEWGRRHGNAIS
ncbi:hypothetical protein JJJ17_06705 [Paracoccus caeni]|uniref:Uncharacterized protein n=1 Tax=Paracoccus caeni TaxID=657651 RepID=A0A934VZA0_9RHOB|nr:hypothetical protein [Paracoccus caeni]MBK4215610.1 hypothetical protein [Paracoccus caeni]